jgi:fatty-acyl-CoA synthase
MIPHRAAVHNPAAIVDAMEAPFDTPMSAWNATGVSWLPLYHDMGLVGSLLVSVLSGIDLWLLSPRTFLGRPATWLRSLGEFACTLAPAPNFAYQTCVERVRPAELDGTSLARWRCAMIGAEMIRPETTAAFAQAFAASGFPPESFRPCYGLAEATLAVTFDRRGEGVRTRTPPGDGSGAAAPSTVACVGAPVRDTEVRIRAPDGTWLAEGGTGEVCVRGPSVFAGYHGDPEATAECLLRDGWLRTGDLGFLDAGELWLTGRTKDLIIVNGQNVMPHEIEWLAESAVGGGGSTRSGAFALAGADGERAVLVVEVVEGGGADLPALAHEIRVRVGRALAVPLADLLFVRRGRIPKTTSGKVQRNELRRLYLAGAIERLPVGSS